MRNLRELDKYRVEHFGHMGDHEVGAFLIPGYQGGQALRVIAANGEGWDHVSVSLLDRCPSWGEMDYIKRLFFHDDETAMQLHVPHSDHINVHPYCLHLWRPHHQTIPRPPGIMV